MAASNAIDSATYSSAVRRHATKTRQFRRRGGQALMRLGEALTRRGRQLASSAGPMAAPPLKLVAE